MEEQSIIHSKGVDVDGLVYDIELLDITNMKSISLISIVSYVVALLPSATLAFIPQNNHVSASSSSALHLYKSAKEAIDEAKIICFEKGPNSEECRVAWDIVEELEAADSRVRSTLKQQQSMGANELSYSPLVDSLELLSVKVERKMDELKALSEQLTAYGAGPEVERLQYASDEMKQILAEARSSLDQYR